MAISTFFLTVHLRQVELLHDVKFIVFLKITVKVCVNGIGCATNRYSVSNRAINI